MTGCGGSGQQRRLLQGVGVSSGLVAGPVVVLKRQTRRAGWYHLPPDHIEREVERLIRALIAAGKELVELKERLAAHLADALSIIDSHLLMLQDKMLHARAAAIIRQKNVNAEWALAQALNEIRERFERIDDPYLRERYADIRQVADRVFGHLAGREGDQPLAAVRPAIIVANDFSPEDVMRLHAATILGFITERGGATSHTAIVARSLGIPAVVGVEHATSMLASGDTIILDGASGNIVLSPAVEEIDRCREEERRRRDRAAELDRYIHLAAETRDGYTVRLSANIETLEELPSVLRHGSEGIGLFRSEFDYFQGRRPPSEEHLYAVYRQLLENMAPYPVTIRTLDVGGDKVFHHFPGGMVWMDQERNPALGLRAIRFSLHEVSLFVTQLRALYRAAAHGRLRILLPLVSSLDELRRVRETIAQVQTTLEDEGLPFARNVELGIMIEVPSAVIMADVLAAEADFFAIGTNDLIQYSLAIDRSNQYVAHLYDPFHPAVLRMIRQTVQAGHGRDIPVSVCGEMAGDIQCAPVLLGLGVDELSMRPAVLPRVKRLLRHSDSDMLSELGARVLRCEDSAKVRAYLERVLPQSYPQEFDQP